MPFYQLPSGASPVLGGTAPPTGGIGVDGDLFIDTTNAILYGPKASGSWPTGIDLSQGPTGPASTVTGPTGAASTVTGPTGAASTVTGPTGAASTVTGPTGAASTVTGPTGAASTVTGPTGAASTVTGPTGPESTVAGPTGATGGLAFTAGPTAPTAPGLTIGGSVWLDTDTGKYFVRYEDQFLEIGVQGEQGPTGATGQASTVTGPTGADSTVTGPTGVFAFAATGPTAPDLTLAGSIWLDTDTGRYFVRYEEQFIEVGVQGEQGPTGATGAAAVDAVNIQTIATGITLSPGDPKWQLLTPTGASQDLTLPTGPATGEQFVVRSLDLSTFYSVVVKTPGGTTVGTAIANTSSVWALWDGSTWRTWLFYDS